MDDSDDEFLLTKSVHRNIKQNNITGWIKSMYKNNVKTIWNSILEKHAKQTKLKHAGAEPKHGDTTFCERAVNTTSLNGTGHVLNSSGLPWPTPDAVTNITTPCCILCHRFLCERFGRFIRVTGSNVMSKNQKLWMPELSVKHSVDGLSTFHDYVWLFAHLLLQYMSRIAKCTW